MSHAAHPPVWMPMKLDIFLQNLKYTLRTLGRDRGFTLAVARGRLEGTEILGSTQIIKAMVPLSNMFGYATELRSRTQGRGAFTMHFGQYEEVPKSIAEEIVSKAQGKVTK